MKIFWTDAVGKKENGHSVVFLGIETVDGVEMVRFLVEQPSWWLW